MNKKNLKDETSTEDERKKDNNINMKFKRQHHADNAQEYNENTKI